MKSYFLFWDQAINFNDCVHVGLSRMYGVTTIILLGRDLCGWKVERTRNSYPFIRKNKEWELPPGILVIKNLN
jgi:hypothetical protein